jgi:hypothetical protein
VLSQPDEIQDFAEYDKPPFAPMKKASNSLSLALANVYTSDKGNIAYLINFNLLSLFVKHYYSI